MILILFKNALHFGNDLFPLFFKDIGIGRKLAADNFRLYASFNEL